MFIKLLSDDDKLKLIKLAALLGIADKAVLWDGKTKEEITSGTNLKNLSFKRGEAESALLTEWFEQLEGQARRFNSLETLTTEIETELLKRLQDIPLFQDTEAPKLRAPEVSAVLRTILKNSELTDVYAIRILLFQLLLMALAGGTISNVEYHFLENVKFHYEVDDSTFNEIRERAEGVYRESQKTIALILE